ncbi:MAG: response regulator transcription factor [Ruminococcus sp.]|nr:response regulator transcription factor [Ruminococcus sp.]
MSFKYSLLIIEDEPVSRELLKSVFANYSFRIYTASNGMNALRIIKDYSPDMALLDLGLPDIDGLRLLRKIRTFTDMPIIVVSARTDEKDKVAALDLGADDYMTKPIGTAELIARVKNVIRHSASLRSRSADYFRKGDMIIDYKRQRVTIEGNDVRLTRNEYSIVELLAKNAGKVITYDYIIKSIWGTSTDGDNRILRVNMTNIRKKIEKDTANPEYIITETGRGYRMIL